MTANHNKPVGRGIVNRWLWVRAASFQTQADYTRYAGTHLAAALTLPLGAAPGAGLAAKLPAYLRPKCAPTLLDPALLSATTLRLNVYQVRWDTRGSNCMHDVRNTSCGGDVHQLCDPLRAGSSDRRSRADGQLAA